MKRDEIDALIERVRRASALSTKLEAQLPPKDKSNDA